MTIDDNPLTPKPPKIVSTDDVEFVEPRRRRRYLTQANILSMLLAVSCALITSGVALFNPSLALIVGGVLLMGWSLATFQGTVEAS